MQIKWHPNIQKLKFLFVYQHPLSIPDSTFHLEYYWVSNESVQFNDLPEVDTRDNSLERS